MGYPYDFGNHQILWFHGSEAREALKVNQKPSGVGDCHIALKFTTFIAGLEHEFYFSMYWE